MKTKLTSDEMKPMKGPGILVQIGERKFYVPNNQPAILKTGKVVLYLIDDNLSIQVGEDQKPRTVLKDSKDYVEELKGAKVIGMVD